MTIFSVADETRRQAREGKEQGVPSNREPLPKIEAETGYYKDTFVAGGSDGNTSGSDDEDVETTETQENEENETDSGATASGGVTFNGDDPSTFAQEGGGDYTSANDLEDSTSAPESGDCIGCDVQKLDDITEGDCATGSGDDFNIHYDGEYPIPNGWEGAETPPADPGHTLGTYYFGLSTGAPDVSNGGAADAWAMAVAQAAQDADGWPGIGPILYVPFYDAGAAGFVNRVIYGTSYGQQEVNGKWGQASCTGSPQESNETVCPTEQITLTSWPDDGVYDLIFDGVAFKGSDLDPNLPDKYKGDGTSFVEYCTSNSKDGSTRTGVDGGYQITTRTEDEEGQPITGLLRYYNSDGRLVAAGDATQTFREQWQP